MISRFRSIILNRFGITIGYSKPMPKEYEDIVVTLARRAGLELDEDGLRKEAMRWEMAHGGISGRTAQQFINYLVYRHQTEE